MSKKTKPHEDEELAETGGFEDLPAGSGAQDESELPTQADETALERAERERDEYLSNWQRAQADYQNLKRRTAQDIEAAIRHAGQGLLDDFLLVLDNLDMALSTPCTTDEAQNLLIGVRMTHDQMLKAFEQNAVTPIPTDGVFDPTVHQAVATIATDEYEPGTILEVVRSGWTHMGNVLRHAHVKVAASLQDSDAPAEESGDEEAS